MSIDPISEYMDYFSQSQLLWTPDKSFSKKSSVEALRAFINRRHGLNLVNFQELYTYSVSHYTFWEDLWDYLEIRYSTRFSKVLEEGKLLKEIPIWFPGAQLNYAENILSRNDDSIACTASSELGEVTHCSYRELRERVRVMASALRSSGVSVGDRVAAIVTNSVTAVVLALATTSIGAVYSSTATDLGVSAILDRYRQIRPKILFCDIEAPYTGKRINILPKALEVIRDLSKHGLEMAVLLPSSITGVDAVDVNCPTAILLSKFLEKANDRPLTFTQLPFNHPAFILYSSGTSGKPKCIVHSAGGVLLQTKKDIMQGLSCRAGETFFQYSSTGWMMWTLMLSTLSFGGRVILYEGSPFYPTTQHFLQFIDQQKVDYFGTSPRFFSEVRAQGIVPSDVARFNSLRFIVSAGAVLTPALHKWAQSAFGPRTCVYTATGGTDICSTFISFSPTLPVYAGELQTKSLGVKVEVFDPAGNNIEHTCHAGELVCTRPHPSLPVCFWGDETGAKLRESYFDMYPGIWCQGDFTVMNPRTKGLVILGRSDGVLNPSGIRFGSSEIYNIMAPFSSRIEDTLCVGQRRPGIDTDERVLLFIKMCPGHNFSRKLATEIRDAIRSGLSPRHVPAWIGEVEDIPYTVNGKKVEIAVKRIVSGVDVQPTATIENPESFKLYYEFRRLQHIDREPRAKL
ncbi:acetoacetyl-CoA synthetase [Amanita rubescens]|nr:acetoacetyl-CoA synthetase [Amanita rubescens]